MSPFRCAVVLIGALFGCERATAAPRLTFDGPAQVVYDSVKDGCTPDDVPDISPRAFRDQRGEVVVFTLQFANKALRGHDLTHLHIDCHGSLPSALDPDPAKYDDRRFLAATWTRDGRDVLALIHHEYHADQHGTCQATGDIACWYNSILAFRSTDGARSFAPEHRLIVASAPFRQDVEQGRHRGFFNPSNIVSDGAATYVFLATTGWEGQEAGSCLFRSFWPRDDRWAAYDGRSFAVVYDDPYREASSPRPCEVILPFTFPVGSVVRQRGTGTWIAVFAASKDERFFPVDGFYYAIGKDLLHWSSPKLLLTGHTIMSDLCRSGPRIIAYPALLDEAARTRNFEDVGQHAFLYYVEADVAGCGTGGRKLLRRGLAIVPSSAD